MNSITLSPIQRSRFRFRFGNSQPLTSTRMIRHPQLARLVNKIFGNTNLGNYARSRIFLKTIKDLPLEKFESIMDLGCGQGDYTLMLAQAMKNCRFTALDISNQAITTTRQAASKLGLTNINYFKGELWNFTGRELFDFIYSVDVFEHILPEEMPFSSSFNLLKTGGYLLVKMPTRVQKTVLPDSLFTKQLQWVKHEHPGQIYNLEDLERRMQEAGFTLVFSSYDDGLTARFAWEIAYLTKKLGPFFQLLFLPFLKIMVILDGLFKKGKTGNTMMVIGRK